MPYPALRPLSATEARVLATLMEKARTVPDSYPLSVNSLVLGCNQKTSRDPFMEVSDLQAQEALAALKQLSLVLEASGSRVTRWEHNIQRALGIPEQSAVVLGLLMLRGPQTAAELRSNSERWYKFADVAAVEGFLAELQQRADDAGGPLVQLLPRAPGAREPRWVHLLCGPVFGPNTPYASVDRAIAATETVAFVDAVKERSVLAERVQALETELATLQQTVQKICQELGLSQPGQSA